MTTDNRPYIDVATPALPRMLTESCIGSFLDKWEDRADFHVRWIFHLGLYHEADFNKQWQANCDMARRVADRFDESVLLLNNFWTPYGVAVWNVLEQVQNDVLWIEDDKLWHKSFRLQSFCDAGVEIAVFTKIKRPPRTVVSEHYGISTAPSFYSYRVAGWWRQNYPADHWRVCERMFGELRPPGAEPLVLNHGGYWEDRGIWSYGRHVQRVAVYRGWIDPETRQFVKYRGR